MRIEILGCHGGELPTCRSTCFLLDESIVLDAGALTRTLPFDRLRRVRDVLVSHSHFDHVKDIPLLADLVVGRTEEPITLHAGTECAKTLKQSIFNGALWPDFTRLPTKKSPVMQLRAFRPGARFKVGSHSVQTVPVTHPVESCAFIVSSGTSAFAMSGDTGPTDRLWEVLNDTPHLKAIFLETSFPNGMQKLADVSGHLTPRTLEAELGKLRQRDVPVFLYHLKPMFVEDIKREVAQLPVAVLELGQIFEL